MLGLVSPHHDNPLTSVYADSAVLAAKLKLVGSCRGAEDRARLDQLQAYAQDLGLQDCVDFCVNASFQELTSLLADAVGGLHTMLDEHFGISIVEYMAAGKALPVLFAFYFTMSLLQITDLMLACILQWSTLDCDKL